MWQQQSGIADAIEPSESILPQFMDVQPVQGIDRQAIGRLAPSPTGALHLGNARTFLLAWLSIRMQCGKLILRVEDIDSPRVKPWAHQATLDDLRWLGLDWDYGPDVGGPHGPYTQTQRADIYQKFIADFSKFDWVYPCICSRAEVAQSASAPHETVDGPIYPGTCRERTRHDSELQNREFAWRWRASNIPFTIHDWLKGSITRCVGSELGDFVVGRSSGWPAYQLAVVIDDYMMGVTEVVRGDDLLASTFRQLDILQRLDWPAPQYAHVPLIVGADGRRLAKRHGDTRVSHFRELGITSRAIVGYLAWTCGLIESPRPLEPQQLLGCLDWSRIKTHATTFDLQKEISILKELSFAAQN